MAPATDSFFRLKSDAWIPWKRYKLSVNIGNHSFFLGRFTFLGAAIKEAEQLDCFADLNPKILDTKRQKYFRGGRRGP